MDTSESRNTRHPKLVEKVDRLGLDHDWVTAEVKNYNLQEIIAKGSFGVVVKAKCGITGAQVAIKRLEGCS